MTNKLFDTFVSDKLKDYESPVPEGLWEKIMVEEERKPVAFWWWNKVVLIASLGVMLILSGVGYFAINKDNTVANKNIAAIQSKNNSVLDNSNSTTNKIEEKGIKNIAINPSTIETLKVNNTIKNTTSITVNLSNKTENNSTAETKKQNTFSSNISSFILKKNYKQPINDFLLKNKKTQKNTTLSNDSITNFNSNEDDKIEANNFSFTSTKLVWENTVMNDKNLVVAANNNLMKILSIGKLFTDDCPTTRGVFRNDLYVEGYISPDFAFKNVASTKQGNDAYISKKDSSETMRLGFTVGARFSKSISNNLLLKAGLQYSQFNEKFTLRTENDRRQTTVINSHTITRPGQADTTTSDTTYFVQIGYRVRTNINHYKNFELPILLSYEFSEPQSVWKLAVTGGTIVNLTSWYEGKTIDAGYNLVNISSKSNNGIYKHQMGVSLYAGVSVIRNISKELDVFAEPYFRYGLSNSLQSSIGFTQKFNAIGIQFGARIKLSNGKHF